MLKSENILLIMRHARSEWPGYLNRDFDRPLDLEGEKQALEIALKINSLGLIIDHALVSPARRTTQTFELLAQNLVQVPEVFFDRRIYGASFIDLINILSEEAPRYNSLLLIGHNPAISELSYRLTKESHEFKPGSFAILHPKKKSLAASLESDFDFNLEKILTP